MDIKEQLDQMAASMITDEQIIRPIPAQTPSTVYSFGFDAEELLATYAAHRTYLKVLANQETEDLEQIQRTTKILIALRPSAVRASKEVSLRAVGIDSTSNSA